MEHLPWIVVHGEWIWRLALVGLAAAALAYTWGRPRLAARRQWRQALGDRSALVSPSARLEGEAIEVEGRLEVEGSCQRFEDGAEAAAASVEGYTFQTLSRRAEALTLSLDGDRIDLEGPVEIAAGSSELRAGKRADQLAEAVRERIAEPSVSSLRGEPVFRSLASGDRVRASGVLRLAGAAEGLEYREAAHRFVLEDVTLAAASTPRVRGPAPSRGIRPIFAAGSVFLLVFWLGAEIFNQVSEKIYVDRDAELEETLDRHGATRFLAATPFRRDEALGRLQRAVSRSAPSVEAREALLALTELRGRCADTVDEMLLYRQFRRALERGERCSSPRSGRLAARAAYVLGEIDRASDLLASARETEASYESRLAMRIHLLAGQWSRAAEIARNWAARYRESHGWLEDDAEAKAYRARLALGHDCLADALATRAGDREALARLERAVAESSANECRLLLADLRGGAERLALLDGWSAPRGDAPLAISGLGRFAELLRLEIDPIAGAAGVLAEPSGFSGALRYSNVTSSRLRAEFLGGLERAILEQLGGESDLPAEAAELQGMLLLAAALEDSLLARHEQASELLAKAWRAPGLDEADLSAAAAFIALRAGDLARARRELDGFSGPRSYSHASMDELVSAIERRDASAVDYADGLISQPALTAALQGDGAALDAELRKNHYHSSLVATLAPWARWLPEEIVDRHLRAARDLSNADLIFDVDSTLGRLANLALLYEAAGDPEHAAALSAAAQRIRVASWRRDIAVPLAVIEAL